MSHKRLWTSAAIIAFIILVSFAISIPRTRDVVLKTSTMIENKDVPNVAIRDLYKNGLHTISGSVEVPNACTTVLAEATVYGDDPGTQGILLDITSQSDTGVCLQLSSSASFEAKISAPEDLPITITVDDLPATTTSL